MGIRHPTLKFHHTSSSLFSDSQPGCAEDVILAMAHHQVVWKRRVTEMVASHKNAKRQGVKACLRPVWNITALRQTWISTLHWTVWQYLPFHCNVWSAGIVQDQGATKASKVVTKSHFSPQNCPEILQTHLGSVSSNVPSSRSYMQLLATSKDCHNFYHLVVAEYAVYLVCRGLPRCSYMLAIKIKTACIKCVIFLLVHLLRSKISSIL